MSAHERIDKTLTSIECKLTIILWIAVIGFGGMLAALWQICLRLPR